MFFQDQVPEVALGKVLPRALLPSGSHTVYYRRGAGAPRDSPSCAVLTQKPTPDSHKVSVEGAAVLGQRRVWLGAVTVPGFGWPGRLFVPPASSSLDGELCCGVWGVGQEGPVPAGAQSLARGLGWVFVPAAACPRSGGRDPLTGAAGTGLLGHSSGVCHSSGFLIWWVFSSGTPQRKPRALVCRCPRPWVRRGCPSGSCGQAGVELQPAEAALAAVRR